ncbi:hypothetical protein K443DRAFT_7338 [Laccaria amethystina LaAM-08-1]|uniref:Secreted protein n=1 Tax=Laccaria amethystina LaAM-08-1 TaxID=1095629 RepID=A0A0C9WQZ6_9AGAR|nr:hypothetical protein K443DRAFT_7338 [Laccaria amethystina LaAM-08-1]
MTPRLLVTNLYCIFWRLVSYATTWCAVDRLPHLPAIFHVLQNASFCLSDECQVASVFQVYSSPVDALTQRKDVVHHLRHSILEVSAETASSTSGTQCKDEHVHFIRAQHQTRAIVEMHTDAPVRQRVPHPILVAVVNPTHDEYILFRKG